MKTGTTFLVALLVVSAVAVGDDIEPGIPLKGEAAEVFLRTAEVVDLEEYDNRGITHPRKATLHRDALTLNAVFKDIDTRYTKTKLSTGRTILNLKDDYKHEIAAYELDKLLGLGLVPPTVERKIGRDRGSLQLWVYQAMTEWQRSKVDQLKPPDMVSWNNQMSTVKVFFQLIWDTDYNNISNILIDENWKIWVIDSSRAFRDDCELRKEDALTRFSRPMLQALRDLDRDELNKTMKPWLNRRQIKAIWERRNRILTLAEERAAAFGEEVVFYD